MNSAAMDVTAPASPQAESLIAESHALWLQGDWPALCLLDHKRVEQLPERAEIALFVAAAHHQLARKAEAARWSRQALDWGSDKFTLSRILIAGVHNTLGRSAALLGNGRSMNSHFEEAVVLSPNGGNPLDGHVRAVHELRELGLLEEAGKILGQHLQHLQRNVLPSRWMDTHVSILKTEVELLQAELSLAQIRGQLKRTERDSEAPPSTLAEAEKSWRSELDKRATSQLGQDLWVLEKTAFKRGGFFVEFGATNGVLLSNTWLLEKEFGWNGICAEPNPRFFTELRNNRLCHLSTACIGATTGEKVEFIFADVYGGMARDADCDPHKDKRDAFRDAGETATLTTISLHDFLIEQGAPRIIDFLSIDTEGSEFSILETFPFGEWDVRHIAVEHNFTAQRAKIRTLLESFGFRCQEAHFDDWYYKE